MKNKNISEIMSSYQKKSVKAQRIKYGGAKGYREEMKRRSHIYHKKKA